MRCFQFRWPLLLAALALPSRASAQQAAADALFDSARASMAKGDLAAACEQFRASDKLDPAAGTELNLADCEEKRGRLASAWALFRSVADKLSETDERLPFARSRASALEARVPRVTLSLSAEAPRDSRVREGDVEFDAAAFGVALPLDPGPHELVLSAPGFEPRAYRFELAEAERRVLTLSPGAPRVAPKPAPGRAVLAPRQEPGAQKSSSRTPAFVLGGVGVAGLTVGTVAGILVLGKARTVDDECRPDKSCSSAGLDAAHAGKKLQVVANVGWAVGAAALGAGLYFFLSSGRSERPTTSLAVTSEPSGGRLSFNRSF